MHILKKLFFANYLILIFCSYFSTDALCSHKVFEKEVAKYMDSGACGAVPRGFEKYLDGAKSSWDLFSNFLVKTTTFKWLQTD